MPKAVKAGDHHTRQQLDRFIKTAKELECEVSQAAFKKAVKNVAKAKPEKAG